MKYENKIKISEAKLDYFEKQRNNTATSFSTLDDNSSIKSIKSQAKSTPDLTFVEKELESILISLQTMKRNNNEMKKQVASIKKLVI